MLARSLIITHPNPAASAIGDWMEWNIPFVYFAGVDLRAVTKMTIGAGDRANTEPGGAGDLYIDDIRLYRPSPTE
jgi:hypothetical protein